MERGRLMRQVRREVRWSWADRPERVEGAIVAGVA